MVTLVGLLVFMALVGCALLYLADLMWKLR